jgi:DNA polymerase type B, organellar and viral
VILNDSRTGSFGITEPPLSKDQRYRRRHREKVDAYEKVRRQGRNAYKREIYNAGNLTNTFVGVDGEGRNTADGRHVYFMLRAGNQILRCRDGDERLRTIDVLSFLCDLPEDYIYVSYFFDYDVTKALEDLSFKKFHKLVHRNTRVMDNGGFFPVDFGDFQFDWFPKKEFKVRRFLGKDSDGKKQYSRWVVIHDMGTFFQAPFAKTLDTWQIGSPYIRRKISEGKDLRAQFSAVTDEYVEKYNGWECECLAELAEKFRKVCIELDYVPKKWQGPGVIAEAAMRKHGVPATEDIPLLQEIGDDSVAAFGRHAYYGPKFETSLVGATESPCHQFDINSAFPAAMQYLPCLLHGTWERRSGKRLLGSGEMSIAFGTFEWNRSGKKFMFGGFPVRRKDGSIHFPVCGKGWYWSFEAESAIHQNFTVWDSWVFTRNCDCKPFAYLEDIYSDRKRLGKSTLGIVLKLIMNSHYGKLVQTIGSPRYSNPIWASFITAWTRTKIANAIHSLGCCRDGNLSVPCGFDCYMIASDAIYVKDYESYDIETGAELGQWSEEIRESGLFIIQPGVYFDIDGHDSEGGYKTRGIPKSVVVEHRTDFISSFERMLASRRISDGDVHLPFSVFIGIRQALQRHNTRDLGKFIEYRNAETGQLGRRTSFDWVTKRQPNPIPGNYTVGRGIRTRPYMGTYNDKINGIPIQTYPYNKDIGGLQRRDMERMAFDDQPDWVRTM